MSASCIVQCVQDTGILTPSVEVQVESVDNLFDLDEVDIRTMLDTPSGLPNGSLIPYLFLLGVRCRRRGIPRPTEENNFVSCWSRLQADALQGSTSNADSSQSHNYTINKI